MKMLSASQRPVAGCSDVICEFPLREMLAYHKQKGAEGTILVTKVSTQSKHKRERGKVPGAGHEQLHQQLQLLCR